jgi:hypothetical protein
MNESDLRPAFVQLRSLRWLRITPDKREIKDFLKLPLATSFIRKTLYTILFDIFGIDEQIISERML